ncbi:hypothetical protein MKX01_041704 [Papaver californicum]|nr:hypothetical protein MKX01_041704 [Papaver californicum]
MAELCSAVLGAMVSELLKKILHQKEKVVCFRPFLERLDNTLETVKPRIESMMRRNQFDEERPEIKELIEKIQEGYSMVQRCSTVKSSEYLVRKRQSELICELDDYLNRFFNIILFNRKFDQLIGRGSSSNYGAREVDDPKAAVPIKPATIRTSSEPPNASSVKTNEKLVRHSERAALEVLPFRDDDNVPFFSTSRGGFGQTSLSEGLELMKLRMSRSITIEDKNSSTKTLYVDNQIVATRYVCEVPVDSDFHFRNVRHENVVPLRAYYYSSRPRPVEQPRRLALQILLVYDYCSHSMGSVSEMLHGKTKVPLDWNARLRVAIGVARGIAFIHKLDNGSFFHGDVKSSCIFLNAENYGCISDLGKCIAGNPNPYVNSSPEFLRESDVYNYGVLLLELVTGNTPRYSTSRRSGLVGEFEDFIGSSKQLDSKVGFFVPCKMRNPEAGGFQVLDRELLEQYGELKEQLIQMLQTALDCVSERAPEIDHVVKSVEGIILSKPTTMTLAGGQKNIITTTAAADSSRESTACAIGKALAALKVVPSFRDDFSVAYFSKSMGGYGKTSLPEGLDLNVLRQGHPKKIGSRAYLYEDTQVVLMRFLCEVSVDFDVHYKHVDRCSREHMLLIERVRHENVAPPRAYYFSCCPTSYDKPRQVALQITLVHDYNTKGSGSDMLHDYFNFNKFIFISNKRHCFYTRESDVYSYGVLLLELITGNTPRYYGIYRKPALVSEFWNYIGTSEQLSKQQNPQAVGFQLIDCELLEQEHYEEFPDS